MQLSLLEKEHEQASLEYQENVLSFNSELQQLKQTLSFNQSELEQQAQAHLRQLDELKS